MMLLPKTNNACTSIARRCMSSTTSRFNHHHPPSTSKSTDVVTDAVDSQQMQILDERTLLTQLSPLKRILCLCPVPLGRGRISWSGGDVLATTSQPQQQQTINLDFQTQHSSKRSISHDRIKMMQQQLSPPPSPKVGKYRYGERFAIGVAVSDPYLTHSVPVQLNRRRNNTSTTTMMDDNSDNGTNNTTCFTAEIVPTFKGDMHNLHTSSPIFHTNLPYFRKDFLQQIGHEDIGAIVVALPMESSSSSRNNVFCPMPPTKLQLEEERKSEEVREYLFGLLQNYVSVDNSSDADEVSFDSNGNKSMDKRGGDGNVPFFGPLNIQGRINHRLSVADVFSNASENGNWDHLVREIRSSSQGNSGNGNIHPSIMSRGSRNFGGNHDESANAANISPEIHAAVALNGMLERHTSSFHNSFF